jgi:hypothetical protein
MKKILFAAAICSVALFAACGNKQNEESQNGNEATDTVVVGEIFDSESTPQGEAEIAAGEAVVETDTCASKDTKAACDKPCDKKSDKACKKEDKK